MKNSESPPIRVQDKISCVCVCSFYEIYFLSYKLFYLTQIIFVWCCVDIIFRSYDWCQSSANRINTPTKMVTEFPSSQFREGHSTQRSPLFDRFNYNYWKCKMKIYLLSLNYELWNIVESSYTKPTTNYLAWNEEQKKTANLDAKAMNTLFYALNKEDHNTLYNLSSTRRRSCTIFLFE